MNERPVIILRSDDCKKCGKLVLLIDSPSGKLYVVDPVPAAQGSGLSIGMHSRVVYTERKEYEKHRC